MDEIGDFNNPHFMDDDEGEIYGLDGKDLSSGYSIQQERILSTFFGPEYEGAALFGFKRGMYGKNGKLQRMGELIVSGKSIREVSRMVGVSKNTVIKLRKVLEIIAGKEFLCECGRPVRHQGWCAHRFSKSDSRQEFVRGWRKVREFKPVSGANPNDARRAA